MFKNYLKTAVRNITRHKGYAFINIAGLAIGMACCILICIFIISELSYDRFNRNADRIYRLGLDANIGGNVLTAPVSNNPAGPVLVRDYAEVENSVRIQPREKQSVSYQDRQFYEERIFWADASIFEVFTFPMIKGDPKTALQNANTVVLTQSAAIKYFGDEDPTGKSLRFDNQTDYTVTGVIEDVPSNSHFTFDLLTSFETLAVRNPKQMEFWLNFNNYVYLLLKDNFDPAELEAKFPALVNQYMGKELKALGGEIKFFLQPLTDIHLHSGMELEIQGNGNIIYVYIFAAIAVFILLIACINFMNLATARSATRAREVSLRKVVGATRPSLVRQFLGESLLYSLVSLVIALALVRLAVPLFSSMSGVELKLNTAQIPWLVPAFIGLIFFVGLAAGSYPAVFLSSFQPAGVLKGSLRSSAAGSRFRSILVTFQFVISITLIIGTGVILQQIRFMKTKSLGFAKNNIMVVQIRDRAMKQARDAIKAQLTRIPGVERFSAASIVPGQQPSINLHIPEGYDLNQSQLMASINVDEDFFPALGIEIIEGRNFSKEYATDPDQAIIINETAAKKFGWDQPLNKSIKIPADMNQDGSVNWVECKVIGVVKDFHIQSLHSVIMPMSATYNPDFLSIFAVRIRSNDTGAVLGRIQEAWTDIDPLRPLEYTFLEDSFDSQYRAEERLSSIFSSFTVFAIFIACLGLFGMASFTAEKRTKEIGIRKVLGASIPGIVTLLSRDFLKLIVIANVIAWPLAYFGMRRWLSDFAYRTGIHPGLFVLTALAALTIALLTVSYQSIRAALSDPVRAIKYE